MAREAYTGEPYAGDRDDEDEMGESSAPLDAGETRREQESDEQSGARETGEEVVADVELRQPEDEPAQEAQPAAEVSDTADAAPAAPVADEPKPAKKRRGGSRGGSGGGKTATTTRGTGSGSTSGRRGRSKRATAVPVAEPPPAPSAGAGVVATPEPIVKTGSTDRHHLIVDEVEDVEPVVPSPHRRPRTYRDLDEIPDDLE